MIALICFVLTLFALPFKSKSRLAAENAALRHQVIVLQRRVSGRVQLTNGDRLFLVMLYRWFPSVLALEIPLSWRPTEDRCGTARVDPADKRGKVLVGSAAYSGRPAQARLPGRSVQRRKVLARHRPHEGAAGRMIESAQGHTHRRGCDHQAYKKRATEEHWPAQVAEFR